MTEPSPLRVLFVCTANICRSAYAEVRSRQLLGEGWGIEVSSAGTHGWVDHPMDAYMAAELRARGADPSGFRSRRLTAQIVKDADLILTMEVKHRDFILDEWPGAFKKTYTLHQFADIASAAPDLDMRRLIAEAPRLRKAPGASGDVPDPYGRGADAATACAMQLDALLTDGQASKTEPPGRITLSRCR